jgi:hypothetical protein
MVSAIFHYIYISFITLLYFYPCLLVKMFVVDGVSLLNHKMWDVLYVADLNWIFLFNSERSKKLHCLGMSVCPQ